MNIPKRIDTKRPSGIEARELPFRTGSRVGKADGSPASGRCLYQQLSAIVVDCEKRALEMVDDQCHISTMDDQVMASGGRVVRIITQRRGKLVDQWFVVGIDDDEEAKKAVCKLQTADMRVEIISILTPTVTARWNLHQGEIKPAASGEPIYLEAGSGPRGQERSARGDEESGCP